MSAKIIVQRKKEFLNKMRPVHVTIDGEEKISLKNGEAQEYEVAPGAHKVQCRLNFYRSKEMTVVVNENSRQLLNVRMGMRYFGVTYLIVFLAIISHLLFRFAKIPLPEWWPWAKLAIIVPVVIYYLYYLTVGRKNYLLLEEDTMFN